DSPSPPQPRHTGEEGVGGHARRLPLPKARTVQLIPGASLAWLPAGSEAKHLEMVPIFRVRLKDLRQDFQLWSFELRICFSFAERGRWMKGQPRPAGLPQEDTPSWTRVRRSPLAPQSQNLRCLPRCWGQKPSQPPRVGGRPIFPVHRGHSPKSKPEERLYTPELPRGHLWFKCFMCPVCVFFF
ncbi:hypothetical protein H8958_003444, partial [Nasalis larvatus]